MSAAPTTATRGGGHAFHEIRDPADPLMEGFWLPLYRSAFPDDERVPEAEHYDALEDPNCHLLVARDSEAAADTPIGMARYDLDTVADLGRYVYLMYMAVAEQVYSKGHGQALFGEIVRRVRAETPPPLALLLEAQDPALSHSSGRYQSPVRRLRFYGRQGCLLLRGIRYLQTVGPDFPPVPMLLLILPLARPVTPEEAFALARNLCGEDAVTQTGELRFEEPLARYGGMA